MGKNVNRNFNNQRGFSLAELMIVLVVGGIMIAMFSSTIGLTATTGARAKSLQTAASNIASSWSTIVTQTGISPASASSAILANSSNTVLDIVMMGDNPSGLVKAAYTTAFKNSGVKPLSDIATVVTAPAVGTAGSYKVNDYTVTMVSTGNKVQISFALVPTNIVQQVYESKMPAAFNASSAVSSGAIQYTAAATDGTHTLTIEQNI